MLHRTNLSHPQIKQSTNPNLTAKQIWLWDEVKTWRSSRRRSRSSSTLNILILIALQEIYVQSICFRWFSPILYIRFVKWTIRSRNWIKGETIIEILIKDQRLIYYKWITFERFLGHIDKFIFLVSKQIYSLHMKFLYNIYIV